MSEPFFLKFGKFCCNVEKEVSELKDLYQAPAGSRPENYDKGMTKLKEEVDSLKELNNQVKSNINDMEKFGEFCDSLEEIISGYKEDIWKAESVLQKFGYKPPVEGPALFFEERNNADMPEGCIPEKQDDSKQQIVLVSPVISSVTLKLLQEKKQEASYSSPVPKSRDEMCSRLLFSANQTPSSVVHRARVQQWLNGVSAVTPDVVKASQSLLSPYIPSTTAKQIFVKSGSGQAAEDKCITCKHPELRSWGSPKLSCRCIGKNVCVSSKLNHCTPEEPVLSNATVEYLSASKKTPEEPTMSFVTQKILDYSRKNPDESNLSSVEQIILCIKNNAAQDASVSKVNNHNSTLSVDWSDEPPPSPQLSETTKYFMNQMHHQENIGEECANTKGPDTSMLKSKAFNPNSHDLNKENYYIQLPEISDVTEYFLKHNNYTK